MKWKRNGNEQKWNGNRMEMGMGNGIRNKMSTNWKWNGSKIAVE